jgi:hypothetical protein
MAEIYVVRNGEVFLDWISYYNYCKRKGLQIRYNKPIK